MNAKQLRTLEPTPEELASLKRLPLYLILDNVLDTYNIGALFRVADAVGVKKIYLCGETMRPPSSKISKAAVDTDKWVEWEWVETAGEAVSKIKNQPFDFAQGESSPAERDPVSREKFKDSNKPLVVALEQGEGSVSYDKANYRLPMALIVGNETFGVSKEVLKLADLIVEIPLFGINKSLNVMVATAICLYEATKGIGGEKGDRRV
ncbi:MAG: TrmH family RNA methyltransferase [bacterium]|nr:TrmH family RNA methyltransferase [bacterium]